MIRVSLSEITTTGLAEDIPSHFFSLSNKAILLHDRLQATQPRTNKSVAFANFSRYVSRELSAFSSFYPTNVSGLAWATRNLFEINLIIRHTLSSGDALKEWMGQALKDETDFIDGILKVYLTERDDTRAKTLNERKDKLRDMASRHDLSFSKNRNNKELADRYGLGDEYVGLYKLFSKYVHPSSLFINSWSLHTPDLQWTNIFVVKSQVYAIDSINRISSGVNIDSL